MAYVIALNDAWRRPIMAENKSPAGNHQDVPLAPGINTTRLGVSDFAINTGKPGDQENADA